MNILNFGEISINADADKVNKNYFDFLVEIKDWADLNEKIIQIADGYYDRNDKYIDGGMILVLGLSNDQIEDAQEKAESWGVTRLEYIFNITKNDE